jgi:uncharacterized protein (DUF849 family)
MKKSQPKSPPVTDKEIASLAREAAQAGDLAMVRIAGRALSGSSAARRECSRVILAARALRDT